MVLKYLAGPIIGMIIGYCTNYIAVKMLFYPKKEIYLFGHKLPFTPGAIPKGKPRLAGAIGNVVGNTLISKEDIVNELSSNEMSMKVADFVIDKLNRDTKSLLQGATNLPEASYEAGKEKIAETISAEIVDALSKMDLTEVLQTKGTEVIMNTVRGSMLEMFVTPELVGSLMEPMGKEFSNIIASEGMGFVKPAIMDKLDDLEEESPTKLLADMNMPENMLKFIIAGAFMKLMSSCAGDILDKVNINGMVTEKINEMSIDELEDLVLTVMKKELNTIVNLGALIGLILGLLNIVI